MNSSIWTNWPVKFFSRLKIFLVPCECRVALISLLITGCMAWIACESSFFKLVVFHEPRHHAREAAQFFNNCDILFSCFHWQVTRYHFSQAFLWPLVALKYCANMKNWQKKKQKQKIAKVWYRRTLLVWQYTFYDFQSRALLFDIRLFSELYIGSGAASMNVRVSCEHLGSRAVVISWESLPPKYSRNTPKQWACSRVT